MVQPIPPGCEGFIPHLVVNGASDAIEFYKKAFGAEETSRMPGPDGKMVMHAELNINGSKLYLCDDFSPETGGPNPNAPSALGGTSFTLHQYVKDTDAAMKRAADAGAEIVMPADDMFWGDRYGKVKDPYGHIWGFSTHIKDMTQEEMAEAAASAFPG